MSNKGAIKKTETKNEVRSHGQSRTKTSSSKISNSENKKRLEPEYTKTLRLADQKGDGDARIKTIHSSSTSKMHTSKSSSKENTRSPQTKVSSRTSKENSSSALKSKLTSSSSVSVDKIKTASSRTELDGVKRVASTIDAEKSRPKDKNQKGYSEKRGLSTIYIPKSYSSRLANKSEEKSMQSTRDKEKLTQSKSSDKTQSLKDTKQRKNSRTLSPSEVKVLHSAMGRSVTALNKKSTPVELPKKEDEKDEENDFSYEDDFEDYESDFQECTDSDETEVSEESDDNKSSLQLDPIELQTQEQRKTVPSAENYKTEEDHMHDSGHYELAEARKRAARMESMKASHPNTPPALPELRQPVNKAYSDERPVENKSLPSSDEGFEDSRSGDFSKSPPLSQQLTFIDFRKPKELSEPKNGKKPKSRGAELLEMIKLDTMEWSLLESAPIPYEEFIRSYGKLNTKQTCTQTGEDNFDVEIQTDEILCKNKWTQFPITCRKNLHSAEDVYVFKQEQVGVGSDDDANISNMPVPSFDVLQLNDFVRRAGRVVLSLLEERKLGGTVFQNDIHELPFSDGFVKLSVDSVTFLAGRAVTIVHYSEVLNKVLLTIHSPADEEIETSSKQDYITDCCIGCVWNISEPSMPTKLFYSPCLITACCFHSTSYNIVIAGLEDGSISLWDLKEDEMWHQKVTDKDNNADWVIRSSTYTTAGNAETEGHSSQIVAIRILSKIESKLLEKISNKFVPIQICSLDEEGYLIIWSILPIMGRNIDDIGLSQWGDVRLVKSEAMCLKPKTGANKTNAELFVDMHVDSVENSNIYIATNTSSVVHATCIGRKSNPLAYRCMESDISGTTTCIETCPFKQSYFLVGCDDGVIRLHTLNVERPITQLKNESCSSKIQVLQWSKSKPFTVYALDNNCQIHIWDMSKSDMHPVHTVSMEKWGRVRSMQLSPCRTEGDMLHQYLALGTGSGIVEIHKLRKSFYNSKADDLSEEKQAFVQYVQIL